MDTLYITTHDGRKIEDTKLLQNIENEFAQLVSRAEVQS
jgi:hypothetical protein